MKILICERLINKVKKKNLYEDDLDTKWVKQDFNQEKDGRISSFWILG